MSITLGLNISSLKSQRELARSSDQLASVFERLSSGQRINKASDDAAGLAIADSLRADTRVFNQGVRNLNDGISLLNIADSAIEGLGNIVIRLQELAEQSANGVYGNVQREAIDSEAQALQQEFFRISKSVEFNSKKLLNGDTTSVNLQAGMGTNAILGLGVGGAIGDGTFTNPLSVNGDLSYLSKSADFNGDGNIDLLSYHFGAGIKFYSGNGNGTFTSGVLVDSSGTSDLEILDVNQDGNLDFLMVTNSNEIVARLGNGDGTFTESVTTTSALALVDNFSFADFNGDQILDIVAVNKGSGFEILYGSADGSFTSAQLQASSIIDEIHAADYDNDGDIDIMGIRDGGGQIYIEGLSDGTIDYASGISVGTTSANVDSIQLDVNGDGNLDVVTASATASQLKVFLSNGDGTFNQNNYALTADALTTLQYGDVNGDGIVDIAASTYLTNQIEVFIGNADGTLQPYTAYSTGAAATFGLHLEDFNNDGVLDALTGGGRLTFMEGGSVDGVAPLLDFDLSTMAGARQALPQFQNKLRQLSAQRSEIGAHLSRIQTASNNLTVTAENYKAAESRIRDADIALESSNLVRLNILQQAASAVLAQANLQPELALRLLR